MRTEVATLLIVAFVGSCGGSPERTVAVARPLVARLTALKGTVDVLRAGTVDWVRLEGGELFEDDRVRTYKGSWAQLDFAGGSSLRVEEESLIALGAGVVVERGTLAGELKPGLKLHTPALEAESVSARDIVFR